MPGGGRVNMASLIAMFMSGMAIGICTAILVLRYPLW